MKAKIFCKKEDYEKIKSDLLNGNIELTNQIADYYIIQKGFTIDSILGKYKDEYILLHPNEIIYIESLDNEILCTTIHHHEKLQLREKLFEFEMLFSEQGFIRVSKSYIINVKHIKSIKPTINMRYILKMTNRDEIIVTRSYYYQFKEIIGL